MTAVPPLGGPAIPAERTRTASSFQFIYDQIDVLRRHLQTGMARGAFGAELAGALAGRLTSVEATVDAGVADRSITRADLRRLNEDLHDVRRSIVQARRTAAAAHDAGATLPPRTLDITA